MGHVPPGTTFDWYLFWSKKDERYEVSRVSVHLPDSHAQHFWPTFVERPDDPTPQWPPTSVRSMTLSSRNSWDMVMRKSTQLGDRIWIPLHRFDDHVFMEPYTHRLFSLPPMPADLPVYGVYAWDGQIGMLLGVWAASRWIKASSLAHLRKVLSADDRNRFETEILPTFSQKVWGQSKSDQTDDLREVAIEAALEGYVHGIRDLNVLIELAGKHVKALRLGLLQQAYSTESYDTPTIREHTPAPVDERSDLQDTRPRADQKIEQNQIHLVYGKKLKEILKPGDLPVVAEIFKLQGMLYGWGSNPTPSESSDDIKSKVIARLRAAANKGLLALEDFQTFIEEGQATGTYGITRKIRRGA